MHFKPGRIRFWKVKKVHFSPSGCQNSAQFGPKLSNSAHRFYIWKVHQKCYMTIIYVFFISRTVINLQRHQVMRFFPIKKRIVGVNIFFPERHKTGYGGVQKWILEILQFSRFKVHSGQFYIWIHEKWDLKTLWGVFRAQGPLYSVLGWKNEKIAIFHQNLHFWLFWAKTMGFWACLDWLFCTGVGLSGLTTFWGFCHAHKTFQRHL